MRRAVGEPLIRTRRWTRQEYDRLIELGILHEDEPIELLAGRLVVREPQRTPHAMATQLAAEALRTAFGPGWSVRVQLPIALDAESEPEPDVAVVHGSPRDYPIEHPSAPVLVVEVAHDSLRSDRILKARLYARAGIGTTGSSTWSTASSRFIDLRSARGQADLRPIPMFGKYRRKRSSRRLRRLPPGSSSPISCPETGRAHAAAASVSERPGSPG